MKRHYSFLFLLCFSVIIIYAKPKTKYPVAEIPKELIGNADAVIRNASYTYEYQAVNKAEERYSMAITILKESALDRSVFSEYYDSFTKIIDIEMVVYDEEGNKVKKISNEDIYDRSAISGFSIYEDSRLKVADPKYSTYPFTVEYSYTRKSNSTYHFPNWYVIDAFNLSVEHSEFIVITPSDYQLRYRENNMPVSVEHSNTEGQNIYTWKVDNFKAFKYEPLSPPADLWVPHVLTAPARFSIDNYEGDLSTWESFGSFYYHLNESQNNIPEETVNKVRSLLTDSMSIYEKVSTIHKYAQNKNRYISVQAGIGGIKPFDAETVDRLSYGDCKALTNYTMSLLKALDINCNYTLVQAGNTSSVKPDFPMDRFNHVFLSIPNESDTLWVECTNSHSPCGFIGDFTDDRYVLVVKEDQSEIVKTPSYSSDDNQQILKGQVLIGSHGDAIANISYNYKGAQYPDQFALTLLDEKDRKKRITQSINAPNFELDSFDIKVKFDRNPELQKDLNIYLFSFVTKMGERMLFKLNTLNTQTYIPPFSRGRKTPLFIGRNYSEKDSIQYLIQDDMAIEAIPDPVEINSDFGIYKSHTEIDENSIYYHRYLVINKGTYPREKYNEFRDFLEKVAKADASSAIIKPKS
ncbi:DUF3857 domain-containing protein [Carboxylicivirga linearis]|uniref:DUF3857 domain-containing transglutaminase family protein n=1 Tax=Carboxylicivirga linearis TaxID=1628157 RepID=A0ABS5JXK9_9BACT|nr:DUF3857 domain-containing protein [Carboxylicivirga linearis]MBS2099629.1 DUF3857 domain-containing transglutaminase family protein [Carboxylicivirga linearis]